MIIVKIDQSNLAEWAKLHALLFPELSFEESFAECAEWLENKKEVGVLYEKDGKYAGFINLSIRNDYVNGTDTSPVAFVEAIYILPEYRRLGIGRELLEYAEKFAREHGITQIASDCFIDNALSEEFHKNCGFVEKERVICFVKNI
ncbi:MAG: GNAT family N-acetyltransferase [Oscillospiraceae bacterium]|nr:GNAT family N-acetyltransferase [Oscillospiraceae bacterium]